MAASRPDQDFQPPLWLDAEGKPVSCLEKIKILNQNLAEIRALARDALEDAVLMGCDEAQIRRVFADLLSDLQSAYRRRS